MAGKQEMTSVYVKTEIYVVEVFGWETVASCVK